MLIWLKIFFPYLKKVWKNHQNAPKIIKFKKPKTKKAVFPLPLFLKIESIFLLLGSF